MFPREHVLITEAWVMAVGWSPASCISDTSCSACLH
eukprot:CAMPEP_0168461788 /NCGR_PEP_ID=MMETSP0228-20121227/54168_1 /TAXON_ID=133427 /ORGANISM="Protoceratium reticulatum, Strain CCCM 535 (=CCMP 1889)" /LENGTH=35 /DNA_ID= /DNA_START= /DNA_END= /DNA_ORIENTATION=